MNTSINEKTLASIRKENSNVKQAVVALIMNVQEPAISKLERKKIGDASLDKIKRYMEAIGGKVSLSVTLPDGSTLNLLD